MAILLTEEEKIRMKGIAASEINLMTDPTGLGGLFNVDEFRAKKRR